MELLEGEIEGYFHGALSLEREGQGLRPNRMTAGQFAHYDQASAAWGIRARCQAGVSLAVHTDSRTLDLACRVQGGARKYLGLDAVIDGIGVHGTRIEPVGDEVNVRVFEFPDRKMRRVQIYMPQSVIVSLGSVKLEPGASVSEVPRPDFRVLCLGDSITQGMDARSPLSIYSTQLARHLDADVLNQGVGGHVFDPGSLDENLPFLPQLVTVAYGTNDWGREISQPDIQDTVGTYLEGLRSILPEAEIAVLSPIWREAGRQIRTGGDLVSFSRAILEAAEGRERVTPIDGLRLVPHQPWYLADGTHPNDIGFLHYGLNIYRELEHLVARCRGTPPRSNV